MIYLTLILALWLGYYLREVLETLKKLVRRTEALRKPEDKKNNASFVEPMTRAEVIGLMEQERVEAMNQR